MFLYLEIVDIQGEKIKILIRHFHYYDLVSFYGVYEQV